MDSSNLRLLEGCAWRDLPVCEQGGNPRTRGTFFAGPVCLTQSRIVQANRTHVYIIGGYGPSLRSCEYDVARSCLRVHLETGILEIMQEMKHARSNGFGVALLGKDIVAVGGWGGGKVVRQC